MVVIVHNADAEPGTGGRDADYFFRFSPDAYAVGINMVCTR